jgi:hypothetical protein
MKTLTMGAKVLLLAVFAYQPGFGPGKQWGIAAGGSAYASSIGTAGAFRFIYPVDVERIDGTYRIFPLPYAARVN